MTRPAFDECQSALLEHEYERSQSSTKWTVLRGSISRRLHGLGLVAAALLITLVVFVSGLPFEAPLSLGWDVALAAVDDPLDIPTTPAALADSRAEEPEAFWLSAEAIGQDLRALLSFAAGAALCHYMSPKAVAATPRHIEELEGEVYGASSFMEQTELHHDGGFDGGACCTRLVSLACWA